MAGKARTRAALAAGIAGSESLSMPILRRIAPVLGFVSRLEGGEAITRTDVLALLPEEWQSKVREAVSRPRWPGPDWLVQQEFTAYRRDLELADQAFRRAKPPKYRLPKIFERLHFELAKEFTKDHYTRAFRTLTELLAARPYLARYLNRYSPLDLWPLYDFHPKGMPRLRPLEKRCRAYDARTASAVCGVLKEYVDWEKRGRKTIDPLAWWRPVQWW